MMAFGPSLGTMRREGLSGQKRMHRCNLSTESFRADDSRDAESRCPSVAPGRKERLRVTKRKGLESETGQRVWRRHTCTALSAGACRPPATQDLPDALSQRCQPKRLLYKLMLWIQDLLV